MWLGTSATPPEGEPVGDPNGDPPAVIGGAARGAGGRTTTGAGAIDLRGANAGMGANQGAPMDGPGVILGAGNGEDGAGDGDEEPLPLEIPRPGGTITPLIWTTEMLYGCVTKTLTNREVRLEPGAAEPNAISPLPMLVMLRKPLIWPVPIPVAWKRVVTMTLPLESFENLS